MRRALLALLVWAGPLAAQDEKVPARMDWFPFLMGDANNGLLIIAHWQIARQADYDQRAPFDWYAGAEAAWGTRGSRLLTLKFRAPLLRKNWRFSGDAGAVREGRFGYYGQGPGGESSSTSPDLPTNTFRVHRTRYFGRAEVTRHIRGPLHAALAAEVTRFRFTPLTDEAGGLFATDYGGGEVSGTDATARLTLVLDTRNNELVPARGVLLEAGVQGGTASYSECTGLCDEGGFSGAYGQFRGYVSPRRGIVFAGRAGFRTLSENAPLDARYEMPGWERELSVYGGFDSNRGTVRGRWVGRKLVLTSAEIRYDLVDGGDYGAVTLLGFLDGGKVWGGEPVPASKWRFGGGGGLALRVLRQALLSMYFAKGPDGFNFTMGNGWAF